MVEFLRKIANYALLITYTYTKINFPFETYFFDPQEIFEIYLFINQVLREYGLKLYLRIFIMLEVDLFAF